MEQWQDAASQQLRLLTSRLNELLTKGLEWLRSEFGVDVGLKPELIPPWIILLAACSGLLLMVALWASVCRTIFRKRPAVSPVDDGVEGKRGASKPVKAEEPKKKKKKAEKKAQPNGRAVAEAQEGATACEERVPHHQAPPPQVKTDKVAESFNAVKCAFSGTWETKVSNKEKREQRKKDKNSSDGSASPGGGDTPVNAPPEQPRASAAPPAPPASQKKKKGESAKAKAEKAEAAMAKSSKFFFFPSSVYLMNWLCFVEAQPVSDLTWLNQPRVEDEWSGLSTLCSADPSSDWNAPSEAWGNYEEPTAEPAQLQEPLLPEPDKAEDDEDDKDKGDATTDGAAKTKKKKKKKKKTSEEGGTPGQFFVSFSEQARGDRPVKDTISQKPPVTQVPQKPTDGEPDAKQNNLPAPTQQKKTEESQVPKPAKKKKARRET
uniref:Protein LYRIC-like n=1 Tax=Poecilia reticulata TaxID=8081 RepID=A0A3P9PT53_POERE